MREYPRHSLADRCLHWGNATLWLLLFFSGVALLHHEALTPFGEAYPRLVRTMVGGGGNLLWLHIGFGIVWILAFASYILTHPKSTLAFIREIGSLRPGDMVWLSRKPAHMLLGTRLAGKLGIPSSLPPQGFYNMGQKAFGMLATVGGLVLAVTGMIMAFGAYLSPLLPWCITVHYVACGLVFTGLLVHLYMTLAVPEERPGLVSMLTGNVPENYAKHHHGLWYADAETAQPPENPNKKEPLS